MISDSTVRSSIEINPCMQAGILLMWKTHVIYATRDLVQSPTT